MRSTMKMVIVVLVISFEILFSQRSLPLLTYENTQKLKMELARKEYIKSIPLAPDEKKHIQVAAEKKSVKKAILLSAILPGAGEAYSGSWYKAAGFFAAEVALWSLKMKYDARGDSQEDKFIQFADLHWSEMRYWTYVYLKGIENGLTGLTYTGNDLNDIHANHGSLPADFILNNLDKLRQWERNLPGFTHQLPKTKTQQYYEMIGKYAGQFGPAWDDASYDAVYNGYIDQITENNRVYMDMRKLANELYENARTAAQFILLNHIISAIDAGFTTKIRNRKIDVSLRSDTRMVNYEITEFVGLHCRF